MTGTKKKSNFGKNGIVPPPPLVMLQLRLVGSHNANLGAVDHGALELHVFQLGRRYFLSDPCVWIYLLRKGAYRDISHIILKHTQ